MGDGWNSYIRAFLALSKEEQEAVLAREEVASVLPDSGAST